MEQSPFDADGEVLGKLKCNAKLGALGNFMEAQLGKEILDSGNGD